jgi:metaxin
MSTLMSDAAAIGLIGDTTWPDNVRLFQPYEVGQILMHEFASCLSVKAFLNMNDLKYQMELRTNAEFMSPSGEVPFIQVGSALISEFNPIVEFVHSKGYSLSSDLKPDELAEMKSYICLVESTIINALLYVMWNDNDTVTMVTKPRYGSPYKWPLNKLIPLKKSWQINRMLSSLGWKQKTMEEVYNEVETCCQALSNKLDKKQFFFGSKPTELDAFVFGYVYTLLTTSLPSARLAEIVQSYANLTDLCHRIHEEYFKDHQKDW